MIPDSAGLAETSRKCDRLGVRQNHQIAVNAPNSHEFKEILAVAGTKFQVF